MSVPTAIRKFREWIREHDTMFAGRVITQYTYLDRSRVEGFIDKIESAWKNDLFEIAHKPCPYQVEELRKALSLARSLFDKVLRCGASGHINLCGMESEMGHANFVADMALATSAYTSPLLNCNVGTAEEQVERYDERKD